MSQNDVLRLLEKSKKPMSIVEIREKLGVRSVDKNIRTLLQHNEIKYFSKVVELKLKNGGSMIKPVLYYYV